MATPAQYIDETKGLTLVSQDGESREMPICLFTAGDWIDPDRKRQNEFLRNGGDEANARCLRRTPNYIEKCKFTPFETWFEPIGINELAGDSMKDLVSIGGVQPDIALMHSPEQFFRKHEPMMGMPHYPGVDIGSLIDQVGYRGVRQIQSLKGKRWDKGEYHEIQQAFFPDDWEVPIALRLVEERIRKVGGVGVNNQLSDNPLRPIAEEMLDACNLFRQAAQERINIEHGLLMTRKEHLHTYRYSRLAPQLLAQLEMNPKDSGSDISQLAGELVRQLALAQPAATPSIPVDIESIVAAAVKTALAAHGVGAGPTAEYVCENCDHEPFTTAQGLALHKTRHCKGDGDAETTEQV